MAKHEFGIMQDAPQKGVRYDEYEPWKYNCISVNDDHLEDIVANFDQRELRIAASHSFRLVRWQDLFP